MANIFPPKGYTPILPQNPFVNNLFFCCGERRHGDGNFANGGEFLRQKRLRGNNPTVLAGRTLQLEADSVNVRHRQQIRYSPHRKVFLVDYPTSVIGIDATRPTGKASHKKIT
ncbi:MAG TPA: hypothetical protein IAC72_03895 [Candidatus Fimimonas merdipullorum]|uniref:Uncharacterized protein n=1 Tax=Candidatus Fimimonas merdipullorum TaxID=2840822 RepID=A0A9D1SPN5_9BACT|nr:hypothetical protein [Candidatus Fimimonas merdipullorum]